MTTDAATFHVLAKPTGAICNLDCKYCFFLSKEEFYAVALEHNGDVYSCDHFVEPKYLLGNIADTPLVDLASSPRQREFGNAKRDTLPKYCRECPVRFACHGECQKNRFIAAPEGEPGLHYLCAGYKSFFNHIDRPMRVRADLLREGRYADEAMEMLNADGRS